MEKETDNTIILIEMDKWRGEQMDSESEPTNEEGAKFAEKKAEVNVIDLSESLLEVLIKGTTEENVTRKETDIEKTIKNGLLIDISDEEKIPFPEALKFHAEVDDTFGLFTGEKKRMCSEHIEVLQPTISHANRHPYSDSAVCDFDKEEYSPLVFDDAFITTTVDSNGTKSPEETPESVDVFASPPYTHPVAPKGQRKSDVNLNNSGDSDLFDIDNLSSFSFSESEISFKNSPKKSKFEFNHQPAPAPKKELTMKEKIALKVNEIFDSPSPKGPKTFFTTPQNIKPFKNYFPTPKDKVVNKSESPDSPDSDSPIRINHPKIQDYKTPTKYIPQANRSSSVNKTTIEPVRLTFSSSSDSVEKKQTPKVNGSFQPKLNSFSIRSATNMIRSKFTSKVNASGGPTVNKTLPMKANIPLPAAAPSSASKIQHPIKLQGSTSAHQFQTDQYRPSSVPVQRRQLVSSPKAPTTPNKTFDKFSSSAKSRLSNVRSSGYGQNSSFNTSLNVSRIPSSPMAQNKPMMKAMTPTFRRSTAVVNYDRRSLSQSDLSISSLPTPAYTSTLKRSKENKPANAKPYKY